MWVIPYKQLLLHREQSNEKAWLLSCCYLGARKGIYFFIWLSKTRCELFSGSGCMQENDNSVKVPLLNQKANSSYTDTLKKALVSYNRILIMYLIDTSGSVSDHVHTGRL